MAEQHLEVGEIHRHLVDRRHAPGGREPGGLQLELLDQTTFVGRLDPYRDAAVRLHREPAGRVPVLPDLDPLPRP